MDDIITQGRNQEHPLRLDLDAIQTRRATSSLTKVAAWISERNLPFLFTSICMIVMLLWAGCFKMTVPGAEGIIPLVSNSPLIWWHFKVFGPYIGSDIIGITEIGAAILYIAGYMWPKAGIVGGFITVLMFFRLCTRICKIVHSTRLYEKQRIRFWSRLSAAPSVASN